MENIGQYPIPQCQYRSNPINRQFNVNVKWAYTGATENASTEKHKYQGMEYANTENLSTIGKGGKYKYGKRKYQIAWVEYASTEKASTNLQGWKT